MQGSGIKPMGIPAVSSRALSGAMPASIRTSVLSRAIGGERHGVAPYAGLAIRLR